MGKMIHLDDRTFDVLAHIRDDLERATAALARCADALEKQVEQNEAAVQRFKSTEQDLAGLETFLKPFGQS